MNIKNIVKEWLTANDYEGLASDECGCDVDELMPCDKPNIIGCVPAMKVLCRDDNYTHCGGCDGLGVCTPETAYMLRPVKEK